MKCGPSLNYNSLVLFLKINLGLKKLFVVKKCPRDVGRERYSKQRLVLGFLFQSDIISELYDSLKLQSAEANVVDNIVAIQKWIWYKHNQEHYVNQHS